MRDVAHETAPTPGDAEAKDVSYTGDHDIRSQLRLTANAMNDTAAKAKRLSSTPSKSFRNRGCPGFC